MKAILILAVCPKCGQRKELTAGYCPTCLEIIQVAEEKRKALKEWVIDLSKKGKK